MDQWHEVLWYKAYLEGRVSLSNLWRLHNEHNIFFPRLAYLLDLTAFRGTNVSLLAWCLLIQTGTCALLIREARRAAHLGRHTATFLAGVYVILLYSLTQSENFVVPFQVAFMAVTGAPIAAIICVAEYAERLRGGRRAVSWLCLGVGCAFVGTFSMANGVLVWPLLLLLALWERVPPRALVGLALVALGTIGLWYAGRAAIGLAPAGEHSIIGMLVFLTVYLGTPLGPLTEDVAGIAGTLGFCLAVGLSLLVVRGFRARSRFDRVCLMILWYTAGSALATTLGRSDWGYRIALVSRYATTSLVFWACAISLSVSLMASSGGGRRYALPVVMGFVAAAFGLLLAPAHVYAGREEQDATRSRCMGELALVVGVEDPFLGALFPDSETLLGLRSFLQEHRLSSFAEAWPHWINRPLAEVARVTVGGPETTGVFGSVRAHSGLFLTPDPEAGVRVRGWVRTAAHSAAPRVLITDDTGIVRGFGRTTAHPDSIGPLYGLGADDATAWFGYARSEANRPLRAYALSEDRRSVSPLKGIHFAGDLTAHPAPVAESAWTGVAGWARHPLAQSGSRFVGGYAFGSAPLQVGMVESQPFDVATSGYLLVPFTTGGNTRGLRLVVTNADTGSMVATCDLSLPTVSWVVWTLPLGSEAPPRIRVRATDAGLLPEQWIAVGQPRLLAPPAPAKRLHAGAGV